MNQITPQTLPDFTLHVETPQERTRRFTRRVTFVSLVLVSLVTLLGLVLNIVDAGHGWDSATLGGVVEVVPAAFCWWLAAYTSRYRLAAWINTISNLTVISGLYWQSPFFAFFLLFVFQLVITRLILGRRETWLVFALLVIITLLYSITHNNNFYSPDEQVVKLDYGTFGLWWLLVGAIIWLTSYLYDNVLRDNYTLNRQTEALQHTLDELRYKQSLSETESRRVLALGEELSVISKQQYSGSQQQVSSLTQIAGSVEEMAQAARNIKAQTFEVEKRANEIGQLTQEVQTAFQEVLQAVESGEEAIQRTVAANQQVGEQYSQLREQLMTLEQFQNKIRTVVDTINSLSQETHLLSLNAAIEAAGAGEYGERFGVVAREVKNLASRSQQSSGQINEILSLVRSGIGQVIGAADSAQSQVELVLKAADEGQAMMLEILRAIDRNVSQVERIAEVVSNIKILSNEASQSTNQQSIASSQAVESLLEIKTIASQNSMTSDNLRQSAHKLEQVSASLVTSLAANVPEKSQVEDLAGVSS